MPHRQAGAGGRKTNPLTRNKGGKATAANLKGRQKSFGSALGRAAGTDRKPSGGGGALGAARAALGGLGAGTGARGGGRGGRAKGTQQANRKLKKTARRTRRQQKRR